MYCLWFSAILSTPLGDDLVANFTELGPFFTGMLDEEDPSYLSHRMVYFYMGNNFFNMTDDDADAMVEVS